MQIGLEIGDAREVRPDVVLAVGVRRHSHQAAEADIRVFLRPEQDVEDFLLLETLLGLLRADVQFQQHADHLAVRLAPVLDGIQQVQAVHGFHQRRVRKDQLELVGLQVPEEMPLQAEVRKFRDLLFELLRTVLAEDALPGVIGLPDGFDRVEFGNCHQFHFRWQFPAYRCNVLSDHYLRFFACSRCICSCIFWASSRRCCHLLFGTGLPAEARTFSRMASLLMDLRIAQVCTMAMSWESR